MFNTKCMLFVKDTNMSKASDLIRHLYELTRNYVPALIIFVRVILPF